MSIIRRCPLQGGFFTKMLLLHPHRYPDAQICLKIMYNSLFHLCMQQYPVQASKNVEVLTDEPMQYIPET